MPTVVPIITLRITALFSQPLRQLGQGHEVDSVLLSKPFGIVRVEHGLPAGLGSETAIALLIVGAAFHVVRAATARARPRSPTDCP